MAETTSGINQIPKPEWGVYLHCHKGDTRWGWEIVCRQR